MPVRIVVDDAVAEAKKREIVGVVGAALNERADADSLIAVVTRLPSGRLTVFINHLSDPGLLTSIEAAMARLR